MPPAVSNLLRPDTGGASRDSSSGARLQRRFRRRSLFEFGSEFGMLRSSKPKLDKNRKMTLKSIAITLVVLSGAVAATEAAARTCTTITHTKVVKKVCYPNGRCRVRRVTTTQQICVANPPTIRRLPSVKGKGFTIRRSRS